MTEEKPLNGNLTDQDASSDNTSSIDSSIQGLNTAGQESHQTTIQGNVKADGDFIAGNKTIKGDEVYGDKVAGNKVTTNIKNYFLGEQEDVIWLRNHRIMLQRVKSTWIEGVLEQSLYKEILIDLNMETRVDAVEFPWDMIIRTPDQVSRPFPHGAKIVDVFDKMNQSLLILGEPGSGKTTMLLELGRDLINRAEQDPTLQMPVVFNLSSWAEKQRPLTEWLVDEFNVKYRIPKKIAQRWIEGDELLLLLDGLDEVKQELRQACVNAINFFRQNHLIPLAICSRTAEYDALTTQLKLESAVVLLPLTERQIDDYLKNIGYKLQAVRTMLLQDTSLQEFVQSPLTLSIIILAYQTRSIEELQAVESVDARYKYLFNAYISKMFAPTAKTISESYSKNQTLRWLRWLASRMIRHGQTLFLIEQMQPSWVEFTTHNKLKVAAVMLTWGPLYGLTLGMLYGLLFGLVYASLVKLTIAWDYNLVNGLLNVLIEALRLGLLTGLFLSLIEGLIGRYQEIKLSVQQNVSWQRSRNILYFGLFWGLMCWIASRLTIGLYDWQPEILKQEQFWAPIFGRTSALIFGLIGGIVGGLGEVRLANPFKVSWERIKSGLLAGLIVGLIGGLIISEFYGLNFGLFFGLEVGLIFGLIGGLFFEPNAIVDIPNTLVTQSPNQGIKLTAKYALVTGLILGLFFGLALGQVRSLFQEPFKSLVIKDNKDIAVWIVRLAVGVRAAILSGLVGGVIGGSSIVTKHLILRFVLWAKGYTPWNYARFLDYCYERIFLRKVGGGYIFIHRMLMEHFAEMTNDDIDRITRSAE